MVQWPHFVILTEPKSCRCTPRKKLIKFAVVFENSFPGPNFYVEEEQDMICWATLNWNVSTEFRLYFRNRHVFDFAGATKGF